MQATVRHVFLKTKHGAPMVPVQQCTAVAEKGLVGDVSFGRSSRQVLLMDLETLQNFDLLPGDVRENLTISGLSLDDVSRLEVGEALLEITDECAPCAFLDELRPGLREQIRGRRGVLARVERGGQIRIGDPISIDDARA